MGSAARCAVDGALEGVTLSAERRDWRGLGGRRGAVAVIGVVAFGERCRLVRELGGVAKASETEAGDASGERRLGERRGDAEPLGEELAPCSSVRRERRRRR